MANLTPSWQDCRVIGIWLTDDHTKLRPGTYTITYPRTTNTKQKAIVPGGSYVKGAPLNTDPGTPLPVADTDQIVGKSIDILIPASTDPDVPQQFKVTLTVTFADGGQPETYSFDAPSGGTVYLDQMIPTVGGLSSVTAASLKMGAPGGVAMLDADGDVIDADGQKVVSSGTGMVPASTTVAGKTRYATTAETTEGVVTGAAVTPAALKVVTDTTVKLTGAQTVDGIKTFTSKPVVPDATFPTAKVTGLDAALTGKMGSVTASGATQLKRCLGALSTQPATSGLVAGDWWFLITGTG